MRNRGFTLIELAIVLVIIGLIIGGILVGRDLILASAVRSQISQMERFKTATNTFKVKFGYLPGDIPNPYAASFGFVTRGTNAGEGDGNETLEGITAAGGNATNGICQTGGETAMFWVDLSTAGLIPGNFHTATPNTVAAGTVTSSTSPALSDYFPTAAIGRGNYVYVWNYSQVNAANVSHKNYFGLIAITSIQANGASCIVAQAGLSVREAYSIDTKIDDGFPHSGTALAGWGNPNGNPWLGASSGTAVQGDSTTCYDNNNDTNQKFAYSTAQNNGAGINCGLSFKLQ